MIKTHPIYYPLYNDKEHFIILITGGRASGKSYATSSFIERLTFEMSKDEGEKVVHNILFTRYTMTSAGISVIPEFLEKIEADGTERYFKATKTDVVNALTGSRVMFRGIKTSSGNQTAKLKSIHGITTFVVDEAEEWTSEEEFEKIVLSIRQKGLQNRVIIIMNPTDNNHFVYKKYIENSHKIVEYDGVPVQISTNPNVLHIHTSYLDNIGNLSEEFLKEVKSIKDTDPDKYAHTIMGRWADVAEGAVFKNWGIVDKFPDECKKVAIGLDFGYTHDPTAIVKCGIIGNRLYIQELCYKTGMLAGDIIKELRKHDLHVIADSADPRLIDEIALGGVIIYPVQKGPGSILAGIDKMKNMEVFYTKDSLNVQKEQRTYVWAKDKDGNYINQPEDANNHCFAGDTLITTNQGEKRIDNIKVGDSVLTHKGYREVEKVFYNGVKEVKTYRLTFDDRVIDITATPDHKIKTSNGWKEIDSLKQNAMLYLCKSSTEKRTGYTKEKNISQEEAKGFTLKCGNITTEKCQKDAISTTRTKTCSTTLLKTLKPLKEENIFGYTQENISKMKNVLRKRVQTWTKQGCEQAIGIAPKMGENGIEGMDSREFHTTLCAKSAESNSHQQKNTQSSVQTLASQHIEGQAVLTMKRGCAKFAATHSQSASTSKQDVVAGSAAKNSCQSWQKKKLQRIEIIEKGSLPVYDIQVKGQHEFFANGLLVHNCMDGIRYYVLGELLGKIMQPKNISKEDTFIY